MLSEFHRFHRFLNVVKNWLRMPYMGQCCFSSLRSQMLAYISYIGWSGYKGAIYQDVHVLVNRSSHLVPDGVILWERSRHGPPQRSAAERFTGLRPAGKRQAWTPRNNRGLWPECLVEAAAESFRGRKLPRSVLKVWSLANGRLEHP